VAYPISAHDLASLWLLLCACGRLLDVLEFSIMTLRMLLLRVAAAAWLCCCLPGLRDDDIVEWKILKESSESSGAAGLSSHLSSTQSLDLDMLHCAHGHARLLSNIHYVAW